MDTPLRPRGKANHVVEEGKEEPPAATEAPSSQAGEMGAGSDAVAASKVKKEYPPSVDGEANWVKKGGKLRFGYKKHVVTDEQGLVLGVLTTQASVNEVSNLGEVLDTVDLPAGTPVSGDKGYKSAKNDQILKDRKLKNRIMRKAAKNRTLTAWETLFNKLVGKTRFKVERTFGGIRRWFNGGVARYRGMSKTLAERPGGTFATICTDRPG